MNRALHPICYNANWCLPLLLAYEQGDNELDQEKWGDARVYVTHCCRMVEVLIHRFEKDNKTLDLELDIGPVEWPEIPDLVKHRVDVPVAGVDHCSFRVWLSLGSASRISIAMRKGLVLMRQKSLFDLALMAGGLTTACLAKSYVSPTLGHWMYADGTMTATLLTP